MWPDHCVQGSEGAKYHSDLILKDSDLEILKGTVEAVESYSGFGSSLDDTGLDEKLKAAGVTKVYCVGLAFDYCVGSTAEDAAKKGFTTYIVKDLTRSVAQDSAQKM